MFSLPSFPSPRTSRAAASVPLCLCGSFLLLVVVVGFLAAPALADPSPAARDSLDGRVFTGYQGWFAPTDEKGNAVWRHLGKRGKFEPGFCGIDLWPDVSELSPEELVPTGFKFADGRIAN